MTFEDLQKQIEEAEAKQAQLRAELERRRAADREVFVNRVRADLSALGMTPKDLMVMLGVERQERKTRGRKPSPVRVLISDPSKTYSGGALPNWLKDAMFVAGYDPKEKHRRSMFIDTHMKVAA